jgi:hypothetical protein
VKIAAYNNHRSAPFLRALVDKRNQVYSAEGADDLIQSFFRNWEASADMKRYKIAGAAFVRSLSIR